MREQKRIHNNRAEAVLLPGRRLPEYSVIRVLCTFGILAYHFYLEIPEESVRTELAAANASLGDILVTMFFCLSGALLYRRYGKDVSWKRFYLRRAKKLFPPFYLVFLYCFIQNAMAEGRLFYRGRPWTLLLSAAGLDGYLLYRIPDYYILGEWFLGAIILLYLLYPLLRRLFGVSPLMTLLLQAVLYAACYAGRGMLRMLPFRTVFSCSLSFTFGMLAVRFRLSERSSALICAGAAGLLLLLVPLPHSQVLAAHLSGFCLFLVLFPVSRLICRSGGVSALFRSLAGCSYEFFLLHHLVIGYIFRYYTPLTHLGAAALLLVSAGTVLFFAWVLHLVAEHLWRPLSSRG